MKASVSILGSGWLGLPLAEHFVQLGYPVKASTRSEKRLSQIESRGATGFIVDIENLPDNIQRFLDSRILIINITSKNIEAFRALIKVIEISTVEKVLFVSSSSVYKNLNRVVTEEEGAENEQSVLFQIENLFRDNKHFATTIVRFAGLIGYTRHPGRFFKHGKVVQQADAPVNLIHRDDCVAIIYAIIEKEIWGEVFNAVADTHPVKREFYTQARKFLDLPPPEFSDAHELAYKIVSNQKVKRVLDYKFAFPDLMAIKLD